ncbi:DUF5133 domain-containing protein [Streptacidiphilus rugosus]|uniref:DUF5133 domain-containing protein n=1 Tax=Streptacidiphilus rugosus TaxID=405783 RepID=UPI000561C13B|nr:DUF5133 domain-containing protein [Streptacidiphilus rugosus]
MLMAHPTVLNNLIKEYAALALLGADHGDQQARRRLEDVTYTLCVATGTRDIDSALAAARYRLPGARPHDDSLLAPERADPAVA